MHGFLAENTGIVSEECTAYRGTTAGASCGEFALCAPVARVVRTYKLQNPSELSIQQELLRNGPVITDWSAPAYLKTYKSGLFDKDQSTDMDSLLEQEHWTPLPNHASVIIGWGAQPNEKQDDLVKYWIVRNSFGAKFGMHGDMHIPRGNNTFNIESDIVGFHPELL